MSAQRRDGGAARPHLGPRHPVRQGDGLQLRALGGQTAGDSLQVLLPGRLPGNECDPGPGAGGLVSRVNVRRSIQLNLCNQESC